MFAIGIIFLAAAIVDFGCSSDLSGCLRFGGGSCCPLLKALDRDISEAVANQPIYIVLLPKNEYSSNIDNICETLFPLPDDSDTYLVYKSIVYNNGVNEINSFVLSQPEPGVRRLGMGLVQYSNTIFAQLECENDVYLIRRCRFYGAFGETGITVSPSDVFGFSQVRRTISRACLSKAEAAVSNNGLPEDDYYILPMRLASRCVLNQVCSVATAFHRFCQTVGVAFPNINRCANIYF